MAISRQAADTLVINARIHTMDTDATIVEAMASKDGQIIGIGTSDELRSLVDDRTEMIDAGGKTAFPGFIETHAHLHKEALARAYGVSWGPMNRPADIAAVLDDLEPRLGRCRQESGQAEGLMPYFLAEKRMPNRWELDSVSTTHPIVCITGPNIPVAANSMALEIAGITRDTVEPEGGRIERNEEGEPIGVLHLKGKLRLDSRHPETVLPSYPAERRLQPVLDVLDDALSYGITSLHDMVSEPEEVQTWIRLRRDDRLTVRIQMLLRGIVTRTPLEHIVGIGLEHGLGDEWLSFGGVKMSIDGVCAYRSAAVYDAFPGEPNNFGVLFIPADVLDAGVEACHRAGIRLIIHAVGQRATDMALDALEKAEAGVPRPDLRHRLEHVHLPPLPGQLERIAAKGYTVGVQPTFVWKHGDAWIGIWGKENLENVMPIRSMLDMGIRAFGGSDSFGTPINPFLGFRSAIARLTRSGELLGAGQAITLDEALRMWTIWAAYGAGEEDQKGSIELGKLADLVIVSEDPSSVPPDELDRVKVDVTMVGGQVAYRRPEA